MITLRPIQPSDIHNLVAVLNENALAEMTNYPYPFTHNDAEEVLEKTKKGVRGMLVIEENGEYLGNISYGKTRVDFPVMQFGYWVFAAARNKGVTTSAVKQFCEMQFVAGIQRIQAIVEPDNAPSIRVLEKSSFEKEGLLRSYYYRNGEASDVYMFAKVKE
jgi:ribosomal-protein-alanine N-acetyltransferase